MSKKLPPELHTPAPLHLVSTRKQRVKAATQFIPLHGRPFEELLEKLHNERRKTIKFARRVHLNKLRCRFVRHPQIGAVSGEEWMSFLAHHQERHGKQIEEILIRIGKGKAGKQ